MFIYYSSTTTRPGRPLGGSQQPRSPPRGGKLNYTRVNTTNKIIYFNLCFHVLPGRYEGGFL